MSGTLDLNFLDPPIFKFPLIDRERVMEACIHSFPSKNHIEMDNIVFYAGPQSTQRDETLATRHDEWPDIDDILAQVTQAGPPTETNHFDSRIDFDACPAFHSAGIDLAPDATDCQLRDWQSNVLQSVQVGGRPVIMQDSEYPARGEDRSPRPDVNAISFPSSYGHANGNVGQSTSLRSPHATLPPSPSIATSHDLQESGQRTSAALRCSPPSWSRRGDTSIIERRLEQPEQESSADQDSCGTVGIGTATMEEHPLTTHDNIVGLYEPPSTTTDRVDPCTVDDASEDDRHDDSDGPVLPRRRRLRRHPQRRSSDREPISTERASTPCSERSDSHASAVKLNLETPKRLRRGPKATRSSRVAVHSVADAQERRALPTATSEARQPIQCFLQRTSIGAREFFMIELPASGLRNLAGRSVSPQLFADIPPETPPERSARKGRRRARFTPAEQNLLVELKTRRDPQMSWREIKRYFPGRTIGSLQVHYSTQLKAHNLL